MSTLKWRNASPDQIAYQARFRSDRPWSLPLNVHQVRDQMQLEGLRYSELPAHLDDLDAGHIVTAEGGREWRRVTA